MTTDEIHLLMRNASARAASVSRETSDIVGGLLYALEQLLKETRTEAEKSREVFAQHLHRLQDECASTATDAERLRAEILAERERCATLVRQFGMVIAHGDDKHRDWLRAEVEQLEHDILRKGRL